MDSMGMDMDSMGANMFQTVNIGLAQSFWYLIVGVLGLMLAVRLGNWWERRSSCACSNSTCPTKVRGGLPQAWATMSAVGRELSYPQLHISTRYLSWLTPPSLGRLITLFIYWAVIIYMMVSNAIIKDANFWERIGFRNAWVTIMQLPLLYLLATKSSILGMIAGTSYERLNWLHRWVARTMFVTASVHGWHFWSEYAIAGLTAEMLQMMPMIKWGIGAWALLLWSSVSSLAPLRHMWYELFVVQHVLTGFLFLWVVYTHVPSYAKYNVWFAITALCSDRFYRTVLLVWQNIKMNPTRSRCKGGQRIGHLAQIKAVGDDITIVTIKDVHFKWKPGQHLYLWMPQVDLTGHHPYTIASAHSLPGTCVCNSIQLVVRKHNGFSARLHERAVKMQATESKQALTAFVTGPYGLPPQWDMFETLVLVSASTGASFNLPILESVLMAEDKPICTRRIEFLLAAKRDEEIEYYIQRLEIMAEKARGLGIELNVRIAITQSQGRRLQTLQPIVGDDSCCRTRKARLSRTSSMSPTAELDVEKSAATALLTTTSSRDSSSLNTIGSGLQYSNTRPDVDSLIREAVESTEGETSVVVCGGKSLVARTRNCVARLSDERAVHKGTGAQGIHLHVEEYCF